MRKKKEGVKKILLTGGHAGTTAISVIEEILRRESETDKYQIFWIGPKSAFEGKKVATIESNAFKKLGISSYKIISGKLQQKFTLWTIPALLKTPLGFLQSLALLLKIRPHVTLSFGGFTALPVAFFSWMIRIPVIIHEQTSVAGRANLVIQHFAEKIALSRRESEVYFDKNKCVVTGNPIMTQIAEVEPKNTKSDTPTVFVTGGSRGAESINEVVFEIVDKLVKDFFVIHQTGELGYKKAMKVKKSLAKKLSERYQIYSIIDPMDIDNVYREADIIVARAGANTTSEVLAIKRPSVLIPYPWLYLNEQQKNAESLKKIGLALIIENSSLDKENLYRKICEVNSNWGKMIMKSRTTKSPDLSASKKLVDLLLTET